VTKVIGRILSLGFPMPGIQVDNYTILSAPAFFDYDALVVDPRAARALIDEVAAGAAEARTFGNAVVRAKPMTPDEISLGSLMEQRREETRMLLDRDGVVVVFACAAAHHGQGAAGAYGWLPLPEGLALQPPLLVAGEGSQAHVVDWEHPLAGFVSGQLANVAYRAHFDVRRIEGARVFARSQGGAAIGVELPLPRGRLIFVPALKAAPAGDARYAASDALQAGIRHALGVLAQGRMPPWVAAMPLPGLAEREQGLQEARQAAERAREAVEAAEAAYEARARFQRLLWQEGAAGLDSVVFEALRLLGFEVYDREPAQLEARLGADRALIEIEAGEHPVDMAAHHRLRQRIERTIERRGQAPRGILFVNGQRLLPPAQRRHVTDAVRVASETMRYCVAPTTGLYEAVVAKLNGDEESVAAYGQRLMAHDGLLA
jgi:hypothetical protein